MSIRFAGLPDIRMNLAKAMVKAQEASSSQANPKEAVGWFGAYLDAALSDTAFADVFTRQQDRLLREGAGLAYGNETEPTDTLPAIANRTQRLGPGQLPIRARAYVLFRKRFLDAIQARYPRLADHPATGFLQALIPTVQPEDHEAAEKFSRRNLPEGWQRQRNGVAAADFTTFNEILSPFSVAA